MNQPGLAKFDSNTVSPFHLLQMVNHSIIKTESQSKVKPRVSLWEILCKDLKDSR